jgi:hypothetical protein
MRRGRKKMDPRVRQKRLDWKALFRDLISRQSYSANEIARKVNMIAKTQGWSDKRLEGNDINCYRMLPKKSGDIPDLRVPRNERIANALLCALHMVGVWEKTDTAQRTEETERFLSLLGYEAIIDLTTLPTILSGIKELDEEDILHVASQVRESNISKLTLRDLIKLLAVQNVLGCPLTPNIIKSILLASHPLD